MQSYLFLLRVIIKKDDETNIKYMTCKIDSEEKEMKYFLEVEKWDITNMLKNLYDTNDITISMEKIEKEKMVNIIENISTIKNPRNLLEGLTHFIYKGKLINEYMIKNYIEPSFDIFNYFINENKYRVIYMMKEFIPEDTYDSIILSEMYHINNENLINQQYNLRLENNLIDIPSLIDVIDNDENNYYMLLFPDVTTLNVIEGLVNYFTGNSKIKVICKSKTSLYEVINEHNNIVFKRILQR